MQYRGRVKGKEASNVYVVAHLYYELLLIVQKEIARRLDVAVVGIEGRIDGSYQHAFLGDCLRDEALTDAAAGEVCAHYSDIEGRALGRGLETGLTAIGGGALRRVPMAIGVPSCIVTWLPLRGSRGQGKRLAWNGTR